MALCRELAWRSLASAALALLAATGTSALTKADARADARVANDGDLLKVAEQTAVEDVPAALVGEEKSSTKSSSVLRARMFKVMSSIMEAEAHEALHHSRGHGVEASQASPALDTVKLDPSDGELHSFAEVQATYQKEFPVIFNAYMKHYWDHDMISLEHVDRSQKEIRTHEAAHTSETPVVPDLASLTLTSPTHVDTADSQALPLGKRIQNAYLQTVPFSSRSFSQEETKVEKAAIGGRVRTDSRDVQQLYDMRKSELNTTEKRSDPRDGRLYTYEKLREKFRGTFSDSYLRAYWSRLAAPVPSMHLSSSKEIANETNLEESLDEAPLQTAQRFQTVNDRSTGSETALLATTEQRFDASTRRTNTSAELRAAFGSGDVDLETYSDTLALVSEKSHEKKPLLVADVQGTAEGEALATSLGQPLSITHQKSGTSLEKNPKSLVSLVSAAEPSVAQDVEDNSSNARHRSPIGRVLAAAARETEPRQEIVFDMGTSQSSEGVAQNASIEPVVVCDVTVRFDRRLLLLPLVAHDNLALDGLVMSTGNVASVCSAGTFQCRGSEIMTQAGYCNGRVWWPGSRAETLKSEPASCLGGVETDWNYTHMLDLYAAHWDLRKPVLLERTPNQFLRVREMHSAIMHAKLPSVMMEAGIRRLEPVYMIVWRPLCLYWMSTHAVAFVAKKSVKDFAIHELLAMEQLIDDHRWLVKNEAPVFVVNYADILWNFDRFKRRLTSFAPCLGERIDAEFVPEMGVDIFRANHVGHIESVASIAARTPPHEFGYDMKSRSCQVKRGRVQASESHEVDKHIGDYGPISDIDLERAEAALAYLRHWS
eukprot:TRINITY_DN43718_c0_g1_i1.p1 TRINITY_DN43718_c0_g1~~TRINITY_DN43718_c0_g1_i1.p1  ORF type:complete len:827 (-),score=113.90 TRINITY_DN43718_c0_g1_i1:132-2612(-)